jgi:hypothetical protein
MMSAWSRRDFVGGAALFALVIGVPTIAVQLSDLSADDVPTDRQRKLMREVSQLVIPRTSTAGAGDVGVGDFVLIALAHGLAGTRKPVPATIGGKHRRADGSLRHVAWLEHTLDQRAGGDFIGLPPSSGSNVLAALDSEAFLPGQPLSDSAPWGSIKGLILTGYYTSEVGASEELQYELVPGRFDPNVPVTPETRAFSSDWTAVEFG